MTKAGDGSAQPSRVDIVGAALLVAGLAVVWGRAAGTAFWADEAISTGVASHAIGDIPRIVVEESAPPLYYLLLRLWTLAVGDSDTAVHLLSLAAALATVPAAMWAGWSLFGRRAGWTAAVLAGISPFLALYSTEARMYSLAALLATLATAGHLHAFVFRRRRYLVLAVCAQALLLYTHNWGLLFAAAAGVVLLPVLLVADDRRRLALDILLAYGAVAVLYAPWIPSLIDQVRADLQPWGIRATIDIVRGEVVNLLGGRDVFLPLAAGAAIGAATVARRRRWDREAVAMAVLAGIPALILIVGWRASVWHGRYLAVVVAPLVLALAASLARAGTAALGLLGVAVFLGAPLGVKGPPHQKSNARLVAAAVAPSLEPGDLVMVPDPHVVPLMARYLPTGLTYATAWGPVPDPSLVEWERFMARLRRADLAVTLPPLISAVRPGGRVVVVCPPIGAVDGTTPSPAPATATVSESTPGASGGREFDALRAQRCIDAVVVANSSPLLRQEAKYAAPEGVRLSPVEVLVFTRLPSDG